MTYRYGTRQLAAIETARQVTLRAERAAARRIPDAAQRVLKEAPLQAAGVVGGVLGAAWIGSKLVGRLPSLARAAVLLAMAPVRMRATRFVVGAFDDPSRPS